FDFRGVDAAFDLDNDVVKMKAEADFQCQQMVDILRNNLVKRAVDTAAMALDDKAVHSGKNFTLSCHFKQGIDQPLAKKIVKTIKDAKLKVQAAIQGEHVRVTGKKRDDLQNTIAVLKETSLDQPLQFNNFRD
ncbi:MAG: YajQ family cyclic di-GMP-binding protein, partial [Shewanellaceae bacterium]|nr:YajQ family cyclic di-GMP-binding protein [Shewanellaceae bacterium]